MSYFLVAQNFTKLEINFFKGKEKIIFNQKMLPYWVLRNMGLGSEIWKKLIPDPRGQKKAPQIPDPQQLVRTSISKAFQSPKRMCRFSSTRIFLTFWRLS